MADQIYKVRDPQGNIREIKGPAGASDEEVIAQAKRLFGAEPTAPTPAAPAPPARPTLADTGMAPALAAQLQPATNLVTGAVTGLADIASTVYQGARSALPAFLGGTRPGEPDLSARIAAQRQQTERGLADLTLAQPESDMFSAGRLAGQVAPTAFVGPAIAGAARPAVAALTAQSRNVGPLVPRSMQLLEAIRTGGMGATGAGGARGVTGLGTRIAGGAVAGGAAGALTEGTPEGAEIGAAVGAAVPTVVQSVWPIVSGVSRAVVRPFTAPQQVAEDVLLKSVGGEMAAPEATAALRRSETIPTTPGFQRTVQESLIAGGMEPSTTVAALSDRIAKASPDARNRIFQQENQRIGALQAQLARVNEQITQQRGVLTPAALDELTGTRDAILRQIDTQQSALSQAEQQFASQMPVGTQQFGERIAATAENLQKGLRETVIRPSYQKALEAAGRSQINIDNLVTEAEKVLGRPLSSFDPETAPAIVRRIAQLAPNVAKAQPVGSGKISSRMMTQPGAPEPATTTLAELDDLRKAINADISAVKRGASNLSGVTERNLRGLHRAIDEAVDTSTTLSDNAKGLYRTALENYRTLYVPRFREGETGRLLKPAMFGEMRIEPSQIVQNFIKDEDAAAQFVRTFAGDASAYSALRDGVAERFARAATDPITGRIDPRKAASFLESNKAVFNLLENNGVGVRQGLEAAERRAAQSADMFERLGAVAKQFAGKTPDQVLTQVTSSADNMNTALRNLNPTEQDTLRRVLMTRISTLMDDAPQKALGELLDSTGKVRGAYQAALGNDAQRLVRQANDFIEVRKVQADPLLQRANAVQPWIDRQKFTPEQLTALQPVVDDLLRMKQAQEATRAGIQVATPNARALLTEVGDEGVARAPLRAKYMSTIATAVRNTFEGLESALNRKVNAELAAILYNNPEAAAKAIENALARSQRATRAAGVSKVVPAVAGGMAAGIE